MTDTVESLRELLRIEHALINAAALPWPCTDSECPYHRKPVQAHCRCGDEPAKAHRAAVRKALARE